MSIYAVDIKKDENKRYRDIFESQIKELISLSLKDSLYENYKEIGQTWSKYCSFTIMINSEQEVLGYSGLQTFDLPKGYARAHTRTFYHPVIRAKALSGHKLPSFATKLMLPIQVKHAQEMKLEKIFFSMQSINRRDYFSKVVKAVDQYYFKQNWILLENLHNTCRLLPNGAINSESPCWQSIALLNLETSKQEFSLPSMSVQNYLRIYS